MRGAGERWSQKALLSIPNLPDQVIMSPASRRLGLAVTGGWIDRILMKQFGEGEVQMLLFARAAGFGDKFARPQGFCPFGSDLN